MFLQNLGICCADVGTQGRKAGIPKYLLGCSFLPTPSQKQIGECCADVGTAVLWDSLLHLSRWDSQISLPPTLAGLRLHLLAGKQALQRWVLKLASVVQGGRSWQAQKMPSILSSDALFFRVLPKLQQKGSFT